MKIIEVNTPRVTADRIAVIAEGPILRGSRRFRVRRVHVAYLWSAKEHRWGVQHIDLSGPVVKKDGTDGLVDGRKTLWSMSTGDSYDEFRRIARNLAPLGDPQLPGVLDA